MNTSKYGMAKRSTDTALTAHLRSDEPRDSRPKSRRGPEYQLPPGENRSIGFGSCTMPPTLRRAGCRRCRPACGGFREDRHSRRHQPGTRSLPRWPGTLNRLFIERSQMQLEKVSIILEFI
jgi:hypothetical protein